MGNPADALERFIDHLMLPVPRILVPSMHAFPPETSGSSVMWAQAVRAAVVMTLTDTSRRRLLTASSDP